MTGNPNQVERKAEAKFLFIQQWKSYPIMFAEIAPSRHLTAPLCSALEKITKLVDSRVVEVAANLSYAKAIIPNRSSFVGQSSGL